MNSFANTVFVMLFGWARTVIQQVWSAAAEGRLSGFFTWLGDHWLWVALIVCLGCTAVDFLVWIVRWRPYLVWQTYLRRVRRFLRGERRHEKRFERGYRDAVVPVDLTQAAQAAPQPRAESWSEAEWAAPEVSVPSDDAYPEETELPPAYDPPARERVFAPPAYEPPPLQTALEQEGGYAAFPAARRRRRSDKYDKKRGALHKRLADIARPDEGMLDGLPPAVDRQSAFYEPVYPQQSAAQGDGGNGSGI